MRGISKLFVIICIMMCQCVMFKGIPADKYAEYYQKNRNKFCKTIVRNGITATVCYQPVEYCAARQLMAMQNISVDSAVARYMNTATFAICIENHDSLGVSQVLLNGGMSRYKENLENNLFNKNSDIFLVHGKDTLTAADCIYERSWRTWDPDVFVVSFPRNALRSKLKNYRLFIRNIDDRLGTLDISIQSLCLNGKKVLTPYAQ